MVKRNVGTSLPANTTITMNLGKYVIASDWRPLFHGNYGLNWGWNPNQIITFNGRVRFNNTVQTCTTPSLQQIHLGMALANDFGGINTTANPTNFSIELDCGIYLNSVQYRLLGSPGNTAPSNGILPVGTGTTAQGYRVQVVRQNGTAIPFGVWHTAAYNPLTGGTVNIPLQARYIKTSNNVQGGAVKASMIFHMQYP